MGENRQKALVNQFAVSTCARGPGFEPRYAASKATVLPLDDPRMYPFQTEYVQ